MLTTHLWLLGLWHAADDLFVQQIPVSPLEFYFLQQIFQPKIFTEVSLKAPCRIVLFVLGYLVIKLLQLVHHFVEEL